MFDLDEVAEALCEYIDDETGITVNPREVGLEICGENLKVTLFNSEFTEISFDPDCLVEDIAYAIMESVDRLAKKVTEARITSLEKIIKDQYRELEELPIHIEDMGYIAKYRHYTTDDEVERDYPELELVVIKNGEEHCFEVDPYQISEPVSRVDITEKLG